MPNCYVSALIQATYIPTIHDFRSHVTHVGGIFSSYFNYRDPSYTSAYEIFHHGATPKMVSYYAAPCYCNPPRKLRNDVLDYVETTYLFNDNRRLVYDALLEFLSSLPPEDQESLRPTSPVTTPSDTQISALFANALWYSMAQDLFFHNMEVHGVKNA